MNDAKAMVDRVLAQHGAKWTDADRVLLMRVAVRAQELATDALMGIANQDELKQLKSQVAGIAAAEAHIVQSTIRDLLTESLGLVFRAIGIPNLGGAS